MDLNLVSVKKTCSELSRNRAALLEYENTTLNSVMNMAGTVASTAKYYLWTKAGDTTAVWNINKIPSDADFFHACKVIYDNLIFIKEEHISKTDLEMLCHQFTHKEVLISFYGDTSVGKSTLLNSILGDQYLPVNDDAETAVSVKIFFKQNEDGDSIQNFDKLYLDGVIKANGSKDIKELLRKCNSKSRDSKENVLPLELHLNHDCGISVPQDCTMVLLDNPGCGEHGSDIIIKNVDKAQMSSAAFVIVTTFQQYRNNACSEALQSIFSQNKDIIKKQRLAVVINKMDQIFLRRPREASYTKEEVINEVHHFFCESVFQCDEYNTQKDYIFLVCGKWSFYGRMFPKYSEEYEQNVNFESYAVTMMKEFYPHTKENFSMETPVEVKAECLVELSNIAELKTRLQVMATNSFLFLKAKIISDVRNIFENSKRSITERKHKETKSAEDFESKIRQYYQLMESVSNLYSIILKEKRKCKDKFHDSVPTAKLFEEACKKDYDKEDNFEVILLRTCEEAVVLFNSAASNKIRNGCYDSNQLWDDLKSLMKNISKKICVHLSSSDVMTNLMEAYSNRSVQMWKSIVNLRERLLRVLNRDSTLDTKESTISYPKLAGPDLRVSLEVPLDLPLLTKIFNYIQSFLQGREILEPKVQIKFESLETLASYLSRNSENSLPQDYQGCQDVNNDSDSEITASQRTSSCHDDNSEDTESRSSSCPSLDEEVLGTDFVNSSGNEVTLENRDLHSDRKKGNSVPIGSDNPFDQLSSQEITSLSEVQLEGQEASMSQPANADYNPNAQSEGIHNSSKSAASQITLSCHDDNSNDSESRRISSCTSLDDEVLGTDFFKSSSNEVALENKGDKASSASDSSSSVPIRSDNPFDQLSRQEITSLSEVQLEGQEASMSQPANADYNPNAQSEEIHNSSEAVLPKSSSAGGTVLVDDTIPLQESSLHSFKLDMKVSNTIDSKGFDGSKFVEEVTKQLKDSLRQTIKSYVKNRKKNIVLVYCQTYYASAIRILKEFDETAAADLTTAQGFLEANIKFLECHRESIRDLTTKHEKICSMEKQFEAIL